MQMALNSAACRIDIADACQKSWCGYIDCCSDDRSQSTPVSGQMLLPGPVPADESKVGC